MFQNNFKLEKIFNFIKSEKKFNKLILTSINDVTKVILLNEFFKLGKKIVFITNEEVVDDLVDIFHDAKIDNYNNLEENADLGYTLEFLDNDNEVILKVDNAVLTYQDETLKVTYDQDDVADLIKSVE